MKKSNEACPSTQLSLQLPLQLPKLSATAASPRPHPPPPPSAPRPRTPPRLRASGRHPPWPAAGLTRGTPAFQVQPRASTPHMYHPIYPFHPPERPSPRLLLLQELRRWRQHRPARRWPPAMMAVRRALHIPVPGSRLRLHGPQPALRPPTRPSTSTTLPSRGWVHSPRRSPGGRIPPAAAARWAAHTPVRSLQAWPPSAPIADSPQAMSPGGADLTEAQAAELRHRRARPPPKLHSPAAAGLRRDRRRSNVARQAPRSIPDRSAAEALQVSPVGRYVPTAKTYHGCATLMGAGSRKGNRPRRPLRQAHDASRRRRRRRPYAARGPTKPRPRARIRPGAPLTLPSPLPAAPKPTASRCHRFRQRLNLRACRQAARSASPRQQGCAPTRSASGLGR